jgi:hypothetical protein
MMSRFRSLCAAILTLVVAAPALAGDQMPAPRAVSSRTNSAADDCEMRMQKLEASSAEGGERLAEKNEVIGFCISQYRNDIAVGRLVNECAKYEEQPVVKQQFVAECQLAAFAYANALYTLRAGYRK